MEGMLDSHGPAGLALASLSPEQIIFIKRLPKAELHAHLNGSIPISCLQQLARDFDISSLDSTLAGSIRDTLSVLQDGVQLNEIGDFFGLFPAIYALTSTPQALATVTRSVLDSFLSPPSDGALPQCTYLELRSTPRSTDDMSRKEYLLAILGEIESYPHGEAALIVSIDRRMDVKTVEECVELAIELRSTGHAVVGVDLCGDPTKGDMTTFRPLMERARLSGLGLTVHIAETKENSDTGEILSWVPHRLGHATFLNPEEMEIVADSRMAIEICLSSNLLCKTVPRLEDHHLHGWLARNHPLIICSDDTLPFRTTLTAEYALLLASPPLGLGLTKEAVRKLAEGGLQSRFSR
ncbi:Metallo-dependent hydrolase [Clavulina sp. PMI_390]|nr:Metallo-dependent hydrolase [Clavulina sp. PMI_390]